MKTTTTLMEVMQSELIRNGHNEFFNDNQLSFYDDDMLFIKKAMRYDDDVKKIINNVFFQGITLDKEVHDDTFKRTFVNRFLSREMAFQTVEGLSSQLSYTLLVNLHYINTLYESINDFVLGKQTNNTDNTTSDTSDYRNANSTLPQSQVNINVDNTILTYADDNTITRTKNVTEGNSTNETNKHNLDDLIKSSALMEGVFIEFDKKCFLQVW